MKKLYQTLLLGLVISILLCTGAWATPYSYGGHYYDVIAAPGITWDDARAAALENYYLTLEGHLVTITSADEDTAVQGMISTNGLGEMWAGGYQNPITETTPTAGWTWVNGEGAFPGVSSSSPYANWVNGEPNDAYGPGSEQHLGLNWGSGWNDEAALGNIAGYVIEYDPNTIHDVPVPEPATMLLLGSGLFGLAGFRKKFFKK
jgi:hypothetical protein